MYLNFLDDVIAELKAMVDENNRLVEESRAILGDLA